MTSYKLTAFPHIATNFTICTKSTFLNSNMTFTKKILSSFVATTLLVVHCLNACLAQTNQPNLTTDESALVALKAHITSDPNSILSANWSNATPPCNWIGVTCSSRHNRVIELNMSSMNLSGSLPPQMGNLTFLTSLDLSNNNFGGELPQELANLRRLTWLNLNFNNFRGELPSRLGLLRNLQLLALRNNSFTGFIPPSLSNMANLEILDLSFNSLQGQIPEEIGNLRKLRILAIQYSQLTGPIPVAIFNISTLDTIALCGNKLSGVIPQEIGNLQNLLTFRIQENQLSGPVPETVFNISTLQVLHLSVNSLTGSLPANMCDRLPNLQILILDFNSLEGEIPKQIHKCSALQLLALGVNKFSGSIPREIGNLTMLNVLDFIGNKLSGEIPAEISSLNKLQFLSLANNSLTGSIPTGIFNMSTLTIIGLTNNYLSGTLPLDLGSRLPNLQHLYLNLNNLAGTIPSSISNCSNLRNLALDSNKLVGIIPNSLGNLPLLERLHIFENNLTSESSDRGLSFIMSMTNCRNLRYLWMAHNPLDGILPIFIGNFSTSLESFDATNCKLWGSIPSQVGNLSNLMWLGFGHNSLTGVIPSTLGNIQRLQGLNLADNKLVGFITESLCSLPRITTLHLERNQLSGRIPECLSNATTLRALVLGHNKLVAIPTSLWKLEDLLYLNLTSNFLSGSLSPEIGNLKAATYIGLSRNQLTGDIPGEVGRLKDLTSLILDNNRLEGSIPASIGTMMNLEFLELSHNNLSGSIPKSLEALQYLSYFNVSYNHLSGEIPSNGSFQNLTAESFMFNEGLCGAPRFHVQVCKISATSTSHNSRTQKLRRIGFSTFTGVVALVLAIMLTVVYLRHRRRQTLQPDTGLPSLNELARVSYYELLRATDGYSESNLLGTGSFGSVYKGILLDGTILAIKVFNLQQEAAFRSFDTECEVLRNLRHRNLAKVITSCSNDDFKALLLEYMPNGNLEKWLYSSDSSLDIVQRLDIAIDVACALEYLHHGHITPIAHCDLKPSNILLDENMIAHVSDFGIAKLLADETKAFTKTLATLGYIAPEYGLEGLVSIRCDVYSFGIVLLETFTRKNPNDDRFAGEFSLRRWVEDSLATSVHEVVDAILLRPEDTHFTEKLHCIVSIMDLALKCSMESAAERINMKDVLAALRKIKLKLLDCFNGN